MKRIAWGLCFLFSSVSSFSQNTDNYQKAAKKYFKIDPFTKDPAILFRNIVNDPDFILDTLINPTDSSLFYIRGYYKSFNPFQKVTGRIELQYHQAVSTNRISGARDTTLIYSIIGVTDSTESGKLKAANEALLIYKQLRKHFSRISLFKSKKKKAESYKKHHYYVGNSPVIVSGYGIWYMNKKSYSVIITVNITFAKRL